MATMAQFEEMIKMVEFVEKYPSVDSSTLIRALENLSRHMDESVDTLISVALNDKPSARFLIDYCKGFTIANQG